MINSIIGDISALSRDKWLFDFPSNQYFGEHARSLRNVICLVLLLKFLLPSVLFMAVYSETCVREPPMRQTLNSG